MKGIYDNKDNHELFKSKNKSEFIAKTEFLIGDDITSLVKNIIPLHEVSAVLLGGSIPLQIATQGSDIDLIVIVMDGDIWNKIDIKEDFNSIKFIGDSDGMLLGEIISMINNVEFDIVFVNLEKIDYIYNRLKKGSVRISKEERMLLGRLRTGWCLLDFGFQDRFHPEHNYLELHCSTHDYVCALQELEDAKCALSDNYMLAAHLGRMAVQACVSAYFSSLGVVSTGDKWFRLLENIRFDKKCNCAGEFELLYNKIVNLMFFKSLHDFSDASLYLDEVTRLCRYIRLEIEKNMEFKLAFEICPQIYQL